MELNTASPLELHLESDLRFAIELEQQLELHYQPKVWLDSGRLKGFEALLRWNHPQRGRIPPTDFIPIAEKCGLIARLGEWVAKTALRQLRDWQLRGIVTRGITMAVNVSSHQLHSPDIFECVSRELEETHIPACCLVLEITESALIDSEQSVQALLERIVAAGIGLDLDDFGTGYSCLSYLHRLPFRSIKIDRSFVQMMTEEPKSLKLVSSIIELARSLEMGVIAEGVETEEQEILLRKLGCPVAQGYRYCRPMSASAIESFICSERNLGASETSSRDPACPQGT
jgi:EAL domain-containing protein (putative c-di-GMP-specific phosphodiesterase class I)